MTEDENYEGLASQLHDDIRRVKHEYIICAAIHFDDYLKHPHQPKNIETGFVVCGRRHHNCFTTVSAISGSEKKYKSEKEQGFLTSKDRFVGRKEAGQIAMKAGQTNSERRILFSEDIY